MPVRLRSVRRGPRLPLGRGFHFAVRLNADPVLTDGNKGLVSLAGAHCDSIESQAGLLRDARRCGMRRGEIAIV